MSLVIALMLEQLSMSAVVAGSDACTMIILRGLTCGTMVLTARPSLRPSKSMNRRRHASWTSTSFVTYFDGGSSAF